jgi:hypothetical protein
MALLCVSQQGEFKNTKKTFWGMSISKKFGRKVEIFFFPVVFPLCFFLSRFWPFLCMGSPKTPQKYFLKSDQKISKKGRKVGTSFF